MDVPQAYAHVRCVVASQWVTGEYWDRHKIAKWQRPELPERVRSRVERLRNGLLFAIDEPWRTVRDAISGLPDPTKRESGISNHVLNPGARTHPGHTGSPLDEPAKTLKAGDHGVPGGENMLAYPDGKVRYFTVRESARLQTFPDEFVFAGSWTETMRQLGNAVPVSLAQQLAASIGAKLHGSKALLAKPKQPDDPHFFAFDLDRAIRDQLLMHLKASPILPLETGVGPNESGIYVLYYKGDLVYVGKASKETTKSGRDLAASAQ